MYEQEKVKLKERRKGINEDCLKRKKEKNQTDNVKLQVTNECFRLTSARSGNMVTMERRRLQIIPVTA